MAFPYLYRTNDVTSYLSSQSPLDLNDDELVINRLAVFRNDVAWRDQWTDLPECNRLYESRTDGNNGPVSGVNTSETGSKDIPRRNLIRKAIDDHHAVKIMNRPKVMLRGDRYINPGENVLEREIAHMTMAISEKSINAYQKTVLRDSDYDDHEDSCLRQSSIYAYGILGATIDESNDTRYSKALQNLLSKPLTEWDEIDAAQYELLNKRIEVKYYDSRDVYFQDGIRKYGPQMHRCSYVERFDINSARAQFEMDDLLPGHLPYEALNANQYINRSTTVSMLTTWEQIPIVVNKAVETIDGEEIINAKFTDWVLVKTVILGGHLLEKTVYGREADEKAGIVKGSIKLPLVPIYDRESDQHPYGYPLALQLKLSEEFINRMYYLMYRAARKAVANQGVFIHTSALGNGDLERINTVLDEGGVAVIRGNDIQSHNPDLSKIVQPLNYMNSQLPTAMVEVTRSEEAAFQTASDSVDQNAISRARSGSGKRAQLAVDDRPKTITRALIARGLETFWELVWDHISIHHTSQVNVPIEIPGGGRQIITLNQKLERVIPVLNERGEATFDEAYVSADNPSGLLLKPIEFVLNSTAINMKAVSDGRSELPGDMVSRLQILAALKDSEAIVGKTLRDMVLPDEIKAMDDINRQIEQRQLMERQLQEAQAQRQLLQQNSLQNGGGGPTSFPALNDAGSSSILLQDGQDDVRAGADDLTEQRGIGTGF